jgi:hypothetical protein
LGKEREDKNLCDSPARFLTYKATGKDFGSIKNQRRGWREEIPDVLVSTVNNCIPGLVVDEETR